MSSNIKRKRLHEVDIIRTIAILLVVITHCFDISRGHSKNLDSSSENIIYMYEVIMRLFYAFRLPAIVLVAGYVYNFMSDKREESFKELVASKFKRLIIPSLVFSMAYILLFNIDMDKVQMLYTLSNGAGPLWFLPMLFWNFLIGYFLIRIKINKQIYKILFIILLFLIAFKSPTFAPNIFGIRRALTFTGYFYIGIQLYEYRETITKHLTFKLIFACFAFFTSIFIINEIVLLKVSQIETEKTLQLYITITRHPISLIGTLCFYILVLYLVEIKTFVPSQIFRSLSKKTYGIYVFHQFILILMVSNLKLSHIVDYRIAPLVYFTITIILSLIITNLFLKTKTGKFLIG